MLIVPELETVFILVPRTGTGTLYREIQRVYPRSMLLYRHMEADGCPAGYDCWRRIGVVRHPLMRLQSLYNLMHGYVTKHNIPDTQAWKVKNPQFQASDAVMRSHRQVAGKTFEEWLLNNQEPWTVPFYQPDEWEPLLTRQHAQPENKLSQFQYLRPDLGVEIRKFENLPAMLAEFGLDPTVVKNKSKPSSCDWTREVAQHIEHYCSWDLEQGCSLL